VWFCRFFAQWPRVLRGYVLGIWEASPDDADTLSMTFAVKVAAKQKPKYQNLTYNVGSQDLRWMG
jgi:hypothetical protein